MRVDSSVDKNKIGRVVEDESGRLITTYEVFESQYVRKCICDCKHYRVKGMVAECTLFDDTEKKVGHIWLQNEVAWSLFSCVQGIGISYDGKRLILPCVWKDSPGSIDIKTNVVEWNWISQEFFKINIYSDLIYATWLLASKGGIKVLNLKTGEIQYEVMNYNTNMHHPYIDRLNEEYIIIYSQGGIFLLNMHTDKIYMSKTIFREMMTKDAEFVKLSHMQTDYKAVYLDFYNAKHTSSDDTLGWKTKEIKITLDEIFNNIKESPLGIKIPTTKVGVERVYKKLFE